MTVRAHLGAGKLSGSVALLRPNGKPASIKKFSALTDLARTLSFPSLANPGRWSVRITAKNSLGRRVTVTRKFTLRGPPEGIVRAVTVSPGPSQPATLSINGAFRQIYARFVFSVKPRAGQRVVVRWFQGRREVARVDKPSLRTIATFLQVDASAPPLQAGTWRVVIGAGDRIAKIVTFTVVG